MSVVDVVVLAGGKNSPAMTNATGTSNRALTVIGERTMLDYVVTALTEAKSVERIFVVGDVPPNPNCQSVSEKETLLENVLAGVRAASQQTEASRVLICTSDIPFLTAAGVEDFITRSVASGADFCYPIVPMALCREHFPEMKRTAVKIREGEFTGGNMVMLNPQFLLTHQKTIEMAYASRKSPLQMGRLLGIGLLLRIVAAQTLAPGILPQAMLETGVGNVLGGCKATAIITEYPEIGTDVDKLEDVAIARRLLAH